MNKYPKSIRDILVHELCDCDDDDNEEKDDDDDDDVDNDDGTRYVAISHNMCYHS